jgi:hypothetical protein
LLKNAIAFEEKIGRSWSHREAGDLIGDFNKQLATGGQLANFESFGQTGSDRHFARVLGFNHHAAKQNSTPKCIIRNDLVCLS